MSKGGVAKVYFVLYLAVLLELLIIIVERDEAEEHLHRQNNETMKIVESILSQLYSGSGSESINTIPQDEITLPKEADMATIKEIFGKELKTSREYAIEVGVTDVTLAVKKKEGETSKEYDERVEKLLSLANVQELEYQIFYIPTQNVDTIPSFQTDEYIKDNSVDFMTFESGQSFPGPNGEPWQFVGAYQLEFDKDASYNKLEVASLQNTLDFQPIYKGVKRVGNGSIPRNIPEDSAFYYSDIETRAVAKKSTSGAKKRVFVVNFEPTDRNKAGIYKLRFASQTNRILGVAAVDGKGSELSDDYMVNIGTVQLSVKDLKKVAKELKRRHKELDAVDDIDKLVEESKNNLVEASRNFDASIEKAMEEAAKEDDAADLIGKLRLYKYIAKLASPGQSVNFDQNRDDYDINIRVQTAKPSSAKPYISTLTDDRCFTNAKHTFEIEVGPYKGNNRVTGRILGNSASVTFTPSPSQPTPERGKKYSLIGTVNQELPAGKYVMQYTHEISGKSEVVYDTLYVYEAGIVDESKTTKRFARRANYGGKIKVEMMPNSKNEISANQFKSYVSFDGGTPKVLNGYQITSNDDIVCLADKNNVQVRLVWVQPYTYKEIPLYSSETNIKLEEPAVLAFDLAPKYTPSGNKIRIEVSGVSVLSPSTGLDDKNKKCSLSEPALRDANIDITGYSVVRQPEIVGGDSENGYIVEMEISKNPGVNVKSAQGNVTIPISITAKHPTNGKVSKLDSEIMFSVDYTPTTRFKKRGRKKGGKRAPKRRPSRK